MCMHSEEYIANGANVLDSKQRLCLLKMWNCTTLCSFVILEGKPCHPLYSVNG